MTRAVETTPAAVRATYREWPLDVSATDVAEAAWTVRVAVATSDWLVLPDGCLDVVLVPGRPPLVAGPATAPNCLSYPAAAGAAGLRLLPGAAAALLGVGADELLDTTVPLADIGGPRWPDDLRRAQDAIDRGDAEGAVGGLLAALRDVPRRRRSDGIGRQAAELLRQDPGVPVSTLCRRLHISERQLRRRFTHDIGYGPKRFARTMRLQRFLKLGRRHPSASLATLAAWAGYADQPHLVHDCRALAGRTPGRLLDQRAGVAIDDDGRGP